MIKKRDNFNAVIALFLTRYYRRLRHRAKRRLRHRAKSLIFFGLKSQCIHFHLLQHS